MGFVNRQVIIAFTLGLAIMAVTSNLSRNCEIHIASSSSHGNGKAVPPQKQSIDTIPACQQNPFKGAIDPLHLVTKRMDLWMANKSNAYERSYL